MKAIIQIEKNQFDVIAESIIRDLSTNVKQKSMRFFDSGALPLHCEPDEVYSIVKSAVTASLLDIAEMSRASAPVKFRGIISNLRKF